MKKNTRAKIIKGLMTLAIMAFMLIPAGNISADGPCGSGYKYVGGTCIPDSPTNTGLMKPETLGDFVKLGIQMLLSIAGIIAVVYIIIGGYQYITAGGNDEQAEKGRKALTNAVIGIVVVLLSFVIVTVVSNLIAGKGI